MSYDAIVAGAGIWGCAVARRLAEAGRKVLVLERFGFYYGCNEIFLHWSRSDADNLPQMP